MFKKTLIAVALLAMVLPAYAADTEKIHGWDPIITKKYAWTDISTIGVCLDVGYWIQIDTKGECIEVQQDSAHGDPIESYSGCHSKGIVVKSNFDATLKASAKADPAVGSGGKWTATIGGGATAEVLANSTTTLAVCVVGKEVDISKLTVDPDDDSKQNVAIVTISVLPTEFAPYGA